VVLNLVTPELVATVRARIDAEAEQSGRARPRLAVWVPVALAPGPEAARQLIAQLAVYLAPPGYGEMFAAAGYGPLVERARAGAKRAELAREIPLELVAAVGAIGSPDEILARIREYHAAGADHVAVVPSTAEDPGGRAVLEQIGELR
jgi:alkanesulfonate monooxygenase SsuD/methylene tetrahydromethanopterin reductase-like flavin-dependent oxidoreductase (luciferase family)